MAEKTKKTTAPRAKRATQRKAPQAATAAPINGSSVKTSPTDDQIRQRAYQLHLERGGSPLENWLAAERELKG